MTAIVLSLGNELVLGQTLDTNSAWLSKELADIGWDVAAHATVGDDQNAIEAAIAAAAPRCDLLLISGGLGPTKDDLTRDALARVLKQPLELSEQWLRQMEAFFRRMNRPMVDSNRVQALIPRGARMIPNSAGTAAGIDADYPADGAARRCRIFALPGVPNEMRAMFQRSVKPELLAGGQGRVILSRTLHTFGLGESAVGEMLGNLMDRSRNPSVGTTVSGGSVSLRITSREPNRQLAETKLQATIAECRTILGDLIYGSDDQTLPAAVAAMLTQGPIRRVSVGESCTGGLLAKMLTDVPGSSRYFQRGWITYSDQAKIDLLGVRPEKISAYGAVSEQVVTEMANSVRRQSGADFGLAISGIAGPDGGSPAKPVGTVCIALSDDSGDIARTFQFPGDREMVRDRSAKMTLTLLRYRIMGKITPF